MIFFGSKWQVLIDGIPQGGGAYVRSNLKQEEEEMKKKKTEQNHRKKFMNDSTTHYSLVEAVDLAQTSRYNPLPPLPALRRPTTAEAAAALVPRNPSPKDPAETL